MPFCRRSSPRVSSAPNTVGSPSGPGRLGEPDHAVEAVVVGEGEGAEAEPGRLSDQLLGVGGAVEEAEVGVDVQLRVAVPLQS